MPSTEKYESSLLVTIDGNRWHCYIITTEYSKVDRTSQKMSTLNEYFETNYSYLQIKRNDRKKLNFFKALVLKFKYW